MDIMQGYFTKQGLQLSAKLLAGGTLEITRVMAGSGNTADPLSAVSLPRPRQTLAVNTAERRDNTAVLPVTLAAALAEEPYSLTELGVYARDPDQGEILYKLYQLAKPVDISPGSRLVLRFYLEETVSQDLGVNVLCSPDGLVKEEAFRPVWEKANGVKENAVTYRLAASELQEKLDSLPRCLTQDVTLLVSGTTDQDITVKDFYGNGMLYIQGGAKEELCVTGQIRFLNCACKVILGTATVRADGGDGNLNMLSFQNCAKAEVFNTAIYDATGAKRGIQVSRSRLVLNSVSVSGCDTALLLSYDSCVTVREGENMAAPSYAGNKLGIYVWHGGTVYLCGGIPKTLGGAANSNQGGLIVSSGGALL